jgi:hypothetical protein
MLKIHAVNPSGTSPLNDAPSKIQAAFASPDMRVVWPLLNKIEAGLSHSDFPISVADLDKHLEKSGLKTSQKIVLKAALERAGLLA